MSIKTYRIGFAGIGNMGAAMAANLVRKGAEVVVYDIDRQAAGKFAAEHGCKVAASRLELAAASSLLILMLPDGDVVRQFLLEGADGDAAPVSSMQPGTVVLDMSSSHPIGTRELGKELARRAILLVDAPVSGGVVRAKAGTLAVMAGGDAKDVEAVRPVLDCMASSIHHVGALGAGHAIKVLNNYVSAAGLIAACEAVAVAQQFGIDGETAVRVFNASTGKNNSTENKLSQFVLSGAFNSGFSLGLMRKDLATALDLAERLESSTPLARHVVDAWTTGEREFGKSSDHTEIARLCGFGASAPLAGLGTDGKKPSTN